MNLLLLHQNDFISATDVKVFDRRFDHLKKILKVEPGQSIDAGLLDGKLGAAIVSAMDTQSITLTIKLTTHPPEPTPITLLLALPRPLMLKRILQTVTSMGIKEIHLINSRRVEKSYWESSDLTADVVYQQMILGLEQSRDTVLPQLHFHKHFKNFIEQDLTGIRRNKKAFLAELGNHPPCPGNIQQPAVLAVGPEGGFIADEVAHFVNCGFEAVQIGQRPLRVEAAVTALLGRLIPV